jgi:membrane protease YdiL (CAAX protease family)
MNDSPPSGSRLSDGLAVAFTLGFPTLITWVYFVWLAESAPTLQQTAYGIGKVLQFTFPVFWVMVVQRCRPRLKWPDSRGLGLGAAFGAVVFAATMLLYHGWLKPSGYFAETGEAVHKKVIGFGVDSFWPYVALGTFYSLCHSFLEEYYWRWFVFGQLGRLIPLRLAIAVSSVGFMAHHVLVLGFYFGWTSPATVLFSAAVAVGGAVWAWLYNRSGSLYAVWLSHLLIDAAIFTVGYDLVRPFF